MYKPLQTTEKPCPELQTDENLVKLFYFFSHLLLLLIAFLLKLIKFSDHLQNYLEMQIFQSGSAEYIL